ncbi:diguanylate cyclase domain-containing protein [Actinoplanes derwentensis]|uniref:Diguanylate cyclase (GGDEF) domain-containing protein n=1 Tax=Actinoplanes derwentensis TaxID=113562 RepID=A0A1H1SCB8_9ACTN|nr:diguanylate cyclase [Actinoplanes derwentensis]GID83334.1 hypothetical protein Ade03nite_22580 [Actinoplanes derwentensis]SDS45750.1 diguanylate cyclase (GGDEF) domain-containing protein [Actinoplanes derwentensis]
MSGGKWLAVQYAVYAAAMAGLVAVAVTGVATAEMVAGPAMLFHDLVAIFFGVRACRHPGLARSVRPAVVTLTAAAVLTLTISLTFTATGTTAFPQPGDVMHLATMGVIFAGLLLVPLHRAGKRERWKTLLDAGTVVLGAAMVLWYVAIGPALTSATASTGLILAAACYPVADLLVLFALARVLLRGTGRVSRRALTMIGGAIAALLAGDAYLGWAQAHMSVVPRSSFDFACWLTTHFLFAGAMIELWRQADQPVATEALRRRTVAGKLPYLGIGVGYALMAAATLHERNPFPWYGLVLGGMGLTGLVVARQLLAQWESTEAAETDPLTGLANRARLHDELHDALRRAARTGRPIAVLLIDLNGFKAVNDRLGHQVGDGLLVAVAGAMSRSVRGDDLVGRLGGDEFAVVVQTASGEPDATAVARRILAAIAGPFVVGDLPMNAAASIGVAVSEPGETNAGTLLHRADVAMYDVKRRGSGWQVWHPGLGAAVTGEDDLAGELGALLSAPDDGRLAVTYQPIRSSTGENVGADANLEWDHPVRGLIAADELRALAGRIGAAGRLADRLLSLVLAGGPPGGGYVVVRVIDEQLRRPGFGTELTGHDVVLEVPEGAVATQQDQLTGLRTIGARIAVRDFGTSFAALTALPRLPVDFLRLDPPPDTDDAVTSALLQLTRSLGLTVLLGDLEVPAATRPAVQSV